MKKQLLDDHLIHQENEEIISVKNFPSDDFKIVLNQTRTYIQYAFYMSAVFSTIPFVILVVDGFSLPAFIISIICSILFLFMTYLLKNSNQYLKHLDRNRFDEDSIYKGLVHFRLFWYIVFIMLIIYLGIGAVNLA